jgi:hypothetical protein
MPIFMVGVAALVLGGTGFVVGGGAGATIAHLLHLRSVRVREIQGAEVNPEEEFSSGCMAIFVGALFGSVLGCGMMLGLGYLGAWALAQ